MELDIGGHAAFVDTACGIVIPAGTLHGFLAAPDACLLVLDVPDQAGADRVRRFAVSPAVLQLPANAEAAVRLRAVLDAPRVLERRDLDVQQVRTHVLHALHEDWPTQRMAQLVHLSKQRFHVRWQELTGQTPQKWLRNLRLDAATRALARGDALDTTALCHGYRSASALAYALRRDRKVGARALRAPGQG